MHARAPEVVWLAALGLALLGCGNPCDDLAKKICSCESTETRQQACKARVDNDDRGASPSRRETDRCAELEDSCTCKALACGDLAACGLAHDPGVDLGTRRCE